MNKREFGDCFNEECALIGVWNHQEAANLAYLGLYSQQHRGQEGAGIVSYNDDNCKLYIHKGIGLVSEVFDDFDFQRLPGRNAIGHVRYSTAGDCRLAEVQPFQAEISNGRMALAQNGNLINNAELRSGLIKEGAIFTSTSDTESILHLIARKAQKNPPVKAVIEALPSIKGAYSLLILFNDRLIAARDPNGLRPLVLGEINGSYVLASETCAFDLIGATFVRDIEPGEIVEISGSKDIASHFPFGKSKGTPCIFEYVYFSRPDSTWNGKNVYQARKKMGHELAKESPIEADIVVPVPDSGVAAAIGFSEESGIPFEMGLIRNHYVGRTFIEPQQSIRDFGVKIKHNANKQILNGKRVVVVDDSIVRGTTTKKLIKMFRAAGAKEIHVRITAPPTKGSCFYGIDTPTQEQLIAHQMSVEEIKEYIDADSLAYLSIDGLYRAVNSEKGSMCDACFTKNYPIGVPSSCTVE
ncbi:MAG: amidophosphoribosyltransferase [Deltaproteobacteria bacterium]|nr:amidophosphoribosyltransferase [Deltaproteobacteria bacterium]